MYLDFIDSCFMVGFLVWEVSNEVYICLFLCYLFILGRFLKKIKRDRVFFDKVRKLIWVGVVNLLFDDLIRVEMERM